MKFFFRICMVLLAVFLMAELTVCESPAGGGNNNTNGGSAGRLIINGFPGGSSFAVNIYDYSGTIVSQMEYASVIGNPVGVSLGYAAMSPVTLVSMSGGEFSQSGVFLVVLADTANPVAGLLFKTGVAFTNGGAVINYGELTAFADLPLTGGEDGSFSIGQVSVSAASTSASRGSTVLFSAVVTGTGNPPQTVFWSITSGHAAGTDINGNGLLSVAADEPASSITVRASSTEDTSKYGEAAVTVTGDLPSGGASITINFEGPVEGILVQSYDITNDPYYDPAIPVLENGTWQDGSNPVQYHQFYAQAGISYSINWNDSYQGDNTKSADVGVSAYWKASNASIFGLTDSGWSSPQTFTADRSGIAVLKVEHYNGGNTTGTYAVRYTASESSGATLTLAVADAGSYSNFRWILDGTERSETTGSITIDTTVLDIGLHRITVIAVKAGISYSREIRFRING